jgi:hypothetical protein
MTIGKPPLVVPLETAIMLEPPAPPLKVKLGLAVPPVEVPSSIPIQPSPLCIVYPVPATIALVRFET